MSKVLDFLRWQTANYLAKAATAPDEPERKHFIMLAARCHVKIAERESLEAPDAGINPGAEKEPPSVH